MSYVHVTSVTNATYVHVTSVTNIHVTSVAYVHVSNALQENLGLTDWGNSNWRGFGHVR